MLARSPRLRGAALLTAGTAAVATLALAPLSQAAPVDPAMSASTRALSSGLSRLAAGGRLIHTVTVGDREVTLVLTPVEVRTDAYTVRLQGADGSYVDQQVAPSRAYLGTVRGDRSATAAAVVGHDGVVRGSVVSDRGSFFQFEGGQAEGEPTTDPGTYRWPASADPSLNRTVAPGQVGRRTRGFDIGVDLDSTVFHDDLGGSVDQAVDFVDRLIVQMMITYEGDARLRPAVTRIVIRGSQAQDPYVGMGDDALLNQVQTEWDADQTDVVRDDLLLMHSVGEYGGLAYLNTVGTPGGRALAGYFYGFYNAYPIVRHEIGHTWGPTDLHTAAPGKPGPEGPTIMTGNSLDRFDGTELSAILRHRDAQQKATQPFAVVPTSTHSFAPYAALDLVDRVRGGARVRIRPLANDSDANGDGLRLVSVDRRSSLGRKLTVSGGVVTYRAPRSTDRRRVDSFTYRVVDATGRTATGVVLVRIDGKGARPGPDRLGGRVRSETSPRVFDAAPR